MPGVDVVEGDGLCEVGDAVRAGLSVAMGNAQADIKAQCDLITEDNDHNGVGEAIRRILEL